MTEIGLLAQRQDNAAVFDVRIALQPPGDLALRAGDSAVAEVEPARATDVAVVPERVLRFRNGQPTVQALGEDGLVTDRAVETGLSDGLRVEVRTGVTVGERVVDPSATP